MITYSLYVKRHKKTGLMYLGQTSQNPYTYQGSGKYWTPHIRKHGYNVETTVIQRCYTKSALKAWGIFYSNLWSVVESKKWANLKSEEGDGRGSGKNNPMRNFATKQKHRLAINTATAKNNQRAGVSASWKNPTTRQKRIAKLKNVDQAGNKNNFADKTVYTFRHTNGTVERLTQYDFRKKYSLCQQSVSRFVNGKVKVHRGWQLESSLLLFK